jgi:hypothetical protein
MLVYIIKQYYDYKMVDGKDVDKQAHEIQCMVKELELLKLVVPDLFVARGIIAKLPLSWRDFATTVKTKRTHMSTSDLIASLDVEEKAWAKMDNIKELRIKLALIWCTSHNHMARARINRTRIITRQSKILSLRRRRMRVVLQNHLRNEGFFASRLIRGGGGSQ